MYNMYMYNIRNNILVTALKLKVKRKKRIINRKSN